MMGVFAEFERAMIRDRIKAGQSRARAQGKKIGRPSISDEVEERILALRSEGHGMLKIAREVGVGTGTVQGILAVSEAELLGGTPLHHRPPWKACTTTPCTKAKAIRP